MSVTVTLTAGPTVEVGGVRTYAVDVRKTPNLTVTVSPVGAPGRGLTPGGTTGQVLRKAGPDDFDTEWANVAAPFQHTQTAPSDSWIVNHNKGYRPVAQVYSPGWVEIVARVEHTSENQLVVNLNAAQGGFVVLN